MVNFGPLATEIFSLVWGTPANFNGFRVLAALLHGTLVVSVSQTAALNRGRHLCSAGRPSPSALAHISSCCYIEIDCEHLQSLRPALLNVRDMCYRTSDTEMCSIDRNSTYTLSRFTAAQLDRLREVPPLYWFTAK